MSSSRLSLACLGALLVTACNDASDLGANYAFLRPEHIEFACFARTPSTDDFTVLPRVCCTDATGMSAAARAAAIKACPSEASTLETPRLHALVSQSVRGEIAAVDLTVRQRDRVLDSNRAVPGFTFVDSGGLPSALVVPPRHPRADAELGPQWVYVASAEEYQVRAIPTCRFRSGKECGPEARLLAAAQAGSAAERTQAVAARLRIPLPSAPSDMVLGPDEALWVTLPELGLIARIALAELGAGAAASVTDAFAVDPATQQPVVPQFFRVPPPAALAPSGPVAEAEVYQKLCGLGLEVAEAALAPRLPNAPRAAATTAVRPARLRFDERSRLLLVGDGQAPFVHAFQLSTEGVLTSVGALPTGAPVRDFVVTPVVPTQPVGFPPVPAEDEAAETKRYLYAIDDRDGSLMAFDFALDGGQPRLTPLLAPSPNDRYADRLAAAQPLTTLEVIDTRKRNARLCGQAADGSQSSTDQELDASRDTQIQTEAGPTTLRGVFVMGASASGALSVIDLHDLDLGCRQANQCSAANPVLATNVSDRRGVAVRRHATRRRYAGSLEADVPSPELFTPSPCEAGYVSILTGSGGPLACVSRDPWNMLTETWSADYRGGLPGTASIAGVFERTARAEQLTLRAPEGLDFCARGALPGDLVAVTNAGDRELPASCLNLTSAENETLLNVAEAYTDHLVVEPSAEAGQGARFADLLRCFPDFVSFEVRAKDFLVTSAGGLYLHNVTSAADGACVVDAQKDARLSARAVGGEHFVNPYVSFTPSVQLGTNNKRTASVLIRQGTQALGANIVRLQQGDALPSAIRYVPEVGDVFVLDAASQGLQRFGLTPFEREDTN